MSHSRRIKPTTKAELKPVRMRIGGELRKEANFTDKVGEENYIFEITVPTPKGEYWLFFYGDATAVRSTVKPNEKIPVQLEIRDQSEAPRVPEREAEPGEPREEILFASGEENHLTPGLYIMSDGKIIVTRPEHGWNIEVISHGNPYDMGMNYKCHS